MIKEYLIRSHRLKPLRKLYQRITRKWPRQLFVPLQNQATEAPQDRAKYKRVFLTFGDSRLAASADRMLAQACAMDVFDAIYVANEHNLTPDFFDRFRRRMFFGSRGFGYWCWKPQIVLQALETMDDGDILLYSDIGCHLNPARRDEMLALFTRAERSTFGILGVQISLLERMWTKGDLFDHFGVRDRPDITETGMFAGMMF